MKVPEEVKVAANELIEDFGCHFDYLGKHDGADFYVFLFPEGLLTGLPFVFEHKDGEVRKITGPESLLVIDFFGEDAGEECEE